MFERLLRNPGLRLTRFAVLACCGGLIHAQTTPGDQAPLSPRERALLDRIERLEKKLEVLEARLPATLAAAPASAPASTASAAAVNPQSADAAKAGVLGLTGTTMNLYFDG